MTQVYTYTQFLKEGSLPALTLQVQSRKSFLIHSIFIMIRFYSYMIGEIMLSKFQSRAIRSRPEFNLGADALLETTPPLFIYSYSGNDISKTVIFFLYYTCSL